MTVENVLAIVFFLGVLPIVGAMGPLLAAVRLLQLKEWRWDRLRAHLQEEGVIRSLWGRGRAFLFLGLAGLFLLTFLLGQFGEEGDATHLAFLLAYFSIPYTIAAHALIGIAELFSRRRQMPHWTSKALLAIALSFLQVMAFLALSFWFIRQCEELGCIVQFWMGSALYAVLPFFTSLFVFISWVVLWPLDRFLKKRILDQARQLRASHPDLTVIGITGSVGKTTVKELLAHLLFDRGAIATPAYVNSEMGVAKWLIHKLEAVSPSTELRTGFQRSANKDPSLAAYRLPLIAIIEMGAYRKGEIALLCSIAKPTLGVLTFIGPQHTALFGSLEAIMEAKGELLEAIPVGGATFINGDCEPCRKVAARAPCPVMTIGTGGTCDLEAYDIEENANGLKFRVKDTVYTVPLNGSHNVSNVLLAIAVAMHLKMTPAEIVTKLLTFSPLAQTFSVRTKRGVRVLDDTHNASPMSFKAALAWAKSQPESPKILLTSGLMELGEDQPAIHRDLGAYASGIVDRVIFLNKKNVHDFRQGYGKNVELLSKESPKIPKGALLLCISRMSSSVIENILPQS